MFKHLLLRALPLFLLGSLTLSSCVVHDHDNGRRGHDGPRGPRGHHGRGPGSHYHH